MMYFAREQGFVRRERCCEGRISQMDQTFSEGVSEGLEGFPEVG